jgi:Domain of unknown function (DUF4158)
MDGAEQRGRVATRDVFTDEELDQLRRFPDISREEVLRYFTLTPADEAFVVARHGAANRLGVAVQLCSLPWLGFVPDDVLTVVRFAVDGFIVNEDRNRWRGRRSDGPPTCVAGGWSAQ